ncbi:MAG: hypothetical protein IKS03_07165 [Ruminococcus sp.]|nr:hypothetical protein [Ruminococcus sp.]
MKKTNKIAAVMASLTMISALSVSTASISTYAKTPATIVASSTAEKHMSTVNFAVNSCGNRLSRPTARVTTPVTTRHTTRHIKKQTTTTTTADGTTVEVEKSWWDKVCDFFTFW